MRTLVSLFGLLAAHLAVAATSVESFVPQDEIQRVRQVQARFSAPMIAFGDAKVESPFSLRCAPQQDGQGHWVDERSWVFDFAKDLPAGVSCEFSLRDRLVDNAGQGLEGKRSFRFDTGGPTVLRTLPYQGSDRIDEEQVFVLFLNGAAKEASVLKNAWCAVEGIGERIPVKLPPHEVRKDLTARYSLASQRNPFVMLQCQRRLAPGAQLNLVWDQGIEADSGLARRNAQRLDFKVRPEFRAEVHCERENAKSDCIPLTPIRLTFTAPAKRAMVAKTRLKGENGKVWKPQLDEENEGDEGGVTVLRFKGPFPELSRLTLELPAKVEDDSGRPLINRDKLDLTVKTAAYPPLAKFAADFGIVEKNAGGLLPITLRNLEPAPPDSKLSSLVNTVRSWVTRTPESAAGEDKPGTGAKLTILHPESDEDIIAWWRKLARFDGEVFQSGKDKENPPDPRAFSLLASAPANLVTRAALPKPGTAKEFEVVGIPLAKPGFHVVEVESSRLGASLIKDGKPMFVRASAINTNLGIHFKQGQENSLVWVTRLDNGKPVAGAKLAIRDCNGKLLWQGRSRDDGTARVAAKLDGAPRWCESVQGLFVSARTADDMSFMFNHWQEGIEPWRFNLPMARSDRSTLVRAILDRSLLRPGETVHMKLLARHQTGAGFAIPDAKELPGRLAVEHQGSDEKVTLRLRWDTKGIAEATWKIPADAKLGTYQLNLVSAANKKPSSRDADEEDGADGGRFGDSVGSFQVSEFRLPVMKGLVTPPKDAQVAADAVEVDLHLSWLSGGSAGGEAVRLRSQVRPRWVDFADFEDFVFANGRVDQRRLKARGELATPRVDTRLIDDHADIVLDANGAARVKVKDVPKLDVPAEILHEMEFRDPSGEINTVAARTPLWPSAVAAGLKTEGWTAQKDKLSFIAAAADTRGKARADTDLAVTAWQVKTITHRRRMVGGFYSYDYRYEVKDLGKLCEGKSDVRGLLHCEVATPAAGQIVLQAEAKDADGRSSYATTSLYVVGKDEIWFDQQDSDRIDVLPEKKRYEPGEKARFQVRSPFRQATALVSVEREGVLDTYVMPISGKSPNVEIPVKANYAPNAFVSVLVVRGRVDSVQPTALVDLGRPAMKLGVGEIQVGWRGHELKVDVAADKPVYQTREKAQVKIRVRDAEGKAPGKNAEVALAAVDEALLELKGNESWKLLEAMMARRGYGVSTATGQGRVIGKRHFGKKALPAGGGGGRSSARELFDTLLKWQGRVQLDEQGEASVEVPLNDSLTSFRIVAVANAGASRFGTGQTSIRSTRDLQVLAGLPQLVRDGDRFQAGFTLRNTAQRTMRVTATANAAARRDGHGEPLPNLAPQTLELAAGAARDIAWTVDVPEGVDQLNWEIAVQEDGGSGADRLKLAQQVKPAVPVTVQQSTLVQLDGRYTLAVAPPPAALPGRGGVQVSLRPKLGASSDGVKRYMRDYPFICLEQKTSKAIALNDAALWRGVSRSLGNYIDDNGLARYFPGDMPGSVALTAYVLSATQEARFEMPEDASDRMLQALVAFVEGRLEERHWAPRKDLDERKLMALEALSRFGKVTPKQLESLTIEPNRWPTSAVLDWIAVLQRTPALPQRAERLASAEQVLRARLMLTGTQLTFSTETDDYWWWLMASSDQNAVRAALLLMEQPAWKDDAVKMVRGAMARQRGGHWNTTLANVWGRLMLDRFAAKFEATPVAGETTAQLGEATRSFDWKHSEGGNLQLPWQRDTLKIEHAGTGKPWATISSLAAVPLKAAFAAGYQVKKTVTPIDQKKRGEWHRGDVLRVRLEVDAQSDMTWVVVADPVPAGATLLGRGLARDSQIATSKEETRGLWPSFEERATEAYRAYYAFVPKGHFSIDYTLRLNNEGEFQLPPTRVEAMYAPETFGETPNEKVSVKP